MHVAVSIVGFRNSDDIVRCLQALDRSTHADFEVIICENGGQGAYDVLMAALPSRLGGGQPVRVVLAPSNLGYAGGLNVCFAQTPAADAWWVLNPDTLPEPEAMAAQVARLGVGDCEAVGCTIELPGGRVQSHGGRWRPWLARAVSIGHSTPAEAPIDAAAIERVQNYLNGASMMVGRRFLDTTGPLREEYFLYCEEVEWCLRGLARGMRLGYTPKARVLHYQGTTTGSAGEHRARARLPIYLNSRNTMLLTRDCFPARLPVAALAYLAQLVVRFGRRGAWRQLGYGVSGWAAGLANRRGVPGWFNAGG